MQGAGPSSINGNSSLKVPPPWNIRKAAFNDHGASLDPYKTSVLADAAAIPDDNQRNTFFQNAHGFSINGNPNFQNNVTNVYGGTDGLEILKGFVSFDAQFDSSAQDPERRCHPGTRKNVLKRLRDWVDNPNSTERIFWLHGPAGAGKSAIAQTIAHTYDRSKVAATFFFFKSDVNRNDGNRLFPTLAYQLALSMPAVREHIAISLYERPDLPKAGVETQFNQLLARPFQVLSEDGTQQLGPVIIIDGLDECTNENLQQRFLKIISDAVRDDRFPLRFLVVSRPELHIEQTIRCFQTPILSIDLAKLDDANRDIEKYLVDEFFRIAVEQGLDPTWPGPKIIRDIVYKSSGNFIFASVVIRFVGDPYCFAKTQLDIVLSMKPLKTISPFTILDQLFLEILGRVPDQDFLKRYLAVLTARIAVSGSFGDLYKDDAVLMHVSEKELHANLRRMRSLLRLELQIDVHHKSFLDFLHDSSRSGQYYTGEGGTRRYVELFADSVLRYASTVTEQPDHHDTSDLTLEFRGMTIDFIKKIELSDKYQIMQFLLDLQDNLLQLPNSGHLLHCDKYGLHLLRDFLHLGLYLEFKSNDTSVQSVRNLRNRRGVVSSTTTEIQKMKGYDLDNLLLSLFACIPETMENWSPNEEVIKVMSAILCFDSAKIAKRVRFISDAQKLVDLLIYMIHVNNVLGRIHPDAMYRVSLLGLEIVARVPILPLSFFLNGNHESYHYLWINKTIPLSLLSQAVFVSWILDPRYIFPMLRDNTTRNLIVPFRDVQGDSLSIARWRQTEIPSTVTAIQAMLGLAKAIQYFHSLGVVLHREFGSRDVFLVSNLRSKIRCLCSFSRFLLDKQCKEWFSLEGNIFSFGCIIYEVFSGVDTKPSSLSEKERRHLIAKRVSVPEIPDSAWQLIKRCCAEHPKNRPTIDEVVQKMESWKIM